jgi:tetratricopeptide (TPR) repeat protein
LAYQLRKKLGDWFKVLQILKKSPSGGRRGDAEDQDLIEGDMLGSALGGSDTQLEEAYNEIGDYYMERQKFEVAIKYYLIGRNLERQAECYYILEDYDSLYKIMDQLPDNSEFLSVIKCSISLHVKEIKTKIPEIQTKIFLVFIDESHNSNKKSRKPKQKTSKSKQIFFVFCFY